MARYDARGELAPRDIVARAILREIAATGEQHVWLDLTHLDPTRVEGHFPTSPASAGATGSRSRVTPSPSPPPPTT